MSGMTWAKITLMLFIITIPFIFVEDLGKFVYVNSACIFIAMIIIFYICFDVLGFPVPVVGTEQTQRIIFSLRGFFQFFGIANFSLEGISLVMPIRNKMKRRERFNTYLIAVTAFDVLFSIIISDFAYKVKNPIF